MWFWLSSKAFALSWKGESHGIQLGNSVGLILVLGSYACCFIWNIIFSVWMCIFYLYLRNLLSLGPSTVSDSCIDCSHVYRSQTKTHTLTVLLSSWGIMNVFLLRHFNITETKDCYCKISKNYIEIISIKFKYLSVAPLRIPLENSRAEEIQHFSFCLFT